MTTIDAVEARILGVLVELRGAQTAGELRQRSDRTWRSTASKKRIVDGLEESGLARRLARQHGQSRRRVTQLSSVPDDGGNPPPAGVTDDAGSRLTEMERRLTSSCRG